MSALIHAFYSRIRPGRVAVRRHNRGVYALTCLTRRRLRRRSSRERACDSVRAAPQRSSALGSQRCLLEGPHRDDGTGLSALASECCSIRLHTVPGLPAVIQLSFLRWWHRPGRDKVRFSHRVLGLGILGVNRYSGPRARARAAAGLWLLASAGCCNAYCWWRRCCDRTQLRIRTS